MFDEAKKLEIFELYRKLIALKRRSDALQMLNDDESDKNFITKAHQLWIENKTQLVEILTQLEKSWSEEGEKSDKLAYFG